MTRPGDERPVPDPARGLTPPDRFLFGGDYNPEQWDEATWDEEVRLMRRAGANTATVGVFARSWLELVQGADPSAAPVRVPPPGAAVVRESAEAVRIAAEPTTDGIR